MTAAQLTLDPLAQVTLRPIRTDDLERLRRLFFRLSPETIHRRFFSGYSQPPEPALHRLAEVDYWNRYAVVAVVGDEVVGVARFDRLSGTTTAEPAILVEDAWQGVGLGLLLGRRLFGEAARHGITEFQASILAENRRALALMRRLSPQVDVTLDGTEYAVRATV